MLDAGLLAEVYLRMTRGQKMLVIDGSVGNEAQDGAAALPLVDLSTFALAVIEPSAEEVAAHDALLAGLDKDSGGKTIYRALEAAPAKAEAAEAAPA